MDVAVFCDIRSVPVLAVGTPVLRTVELGSLVVFIHARKVFVGFSPGVIFSFARFSTTFVQRV